MMLPISHDSQMGNVVWEEKISFEETPAFRHVMLIIGEIYPGKTDQQIVEATHACLAKTKSPRSREQYIRLLVKELSGY